MKIKGMDNLLRKLNKLKEIDIKPIMKDATIKVRDEARKNVPVDTAELQNSIDYKVYEEKGKIIGMIFTNKEHGIFVEFGTGPIGAQNHQGISKEFNPEYTMQPWVYYSKDLDRFVFTRGQPARPFMYPALHDNRDKIAKFIKYQVNKKIQESTK